MPEPLIRSASLTGYADLARSLGLDPVRLVAAQGLPSGSLTNPDLWIPSVAVGRLFERTAKVAGIADFGLRLAETRRLSNLGAVGLVLREQPTLRKALDALVNYTWVQNQSLALRLDIHGDIAILREGTGSIGHQSGELMLGVLALTIRRLVGQAWKPLEVHFTHSRPNDIKTHRRVFGVVPQFGQDFEGLVLDAHDLGLQIADADPVAASRVQRYLDQEARLDNSDPSAAVRELILALLPTGNCTIERVAKHMGTSRRTLRRRLADANAPTFTELLNDVRVSLAKRYLSAGHHSLTEIAERLGYGSLSAFSRWSRTNLAKRRDGSHTGRSPMTVTRSIRRTAGK